MISNDELNFILENYGNLLKIDLHTADLAISFFAESEKYADTISPKMSKAKHDKFLITTYQDYSIGENVILTDYNICTIDSIIFVKIVTPFTRERSYDFIVAPSYAMKTLLKKLKEREETANIKKTNFPIIGIDFTEIRKHTIDFLLNEEFRNFCNSKLIKLKRGIVFEGTAGNGKTLTIRWIKEQAAKEGIKFHNIKPSEFVEDIESYYDLSHNEKKIIAFEDFDIFVLDRENTNQVPGAPLMRILNILDGIDEINNVVSIFTTNKIETFDSALLRPGRIDKVIRFNTPTKEQVRQFLQAYIPEKDKLFIDDLSVFLDSKTLSISYAMLKGIVDDINILEFNGESVDIKKAEKVADNKIRDFLKGNTPHEKKDYII